MKKLSWMPAIFAAMGTMIMVTLAVVNLSGTGVTMTLELIAIPCLVGAAGGWLLGAERKNLREKSLRLSDLESELKIHLETVKTEQAISDNLQRMVNRIPLPVYLKNRTGHYIMANPRYEALAGKSWEEIEGKTDYDIFPPPVADIFREQDTEIFSIKEGRTFEETIPLPGGIVTFQTFKFPLQDDHGNLYAVGGICTDITKLKKAEDQLASRQGRIDEVLRHTSEGIIATDCDGIIVMFNARAEALTGHQTDFALGQVLDLIYKPTDRSTGTEIIIFPNQAVDRFPDDEKEREVVLQTHSGQEKAVIQKTVPLFDRFGQNMGTLLLIRSNDPVDSLHEQPPRNPSSTQDNASPTEVQPVKGHILIMDDDRLVRKTIGLMLKTGGYESVKASCGAEAVRIYGEMMNTEASIDVVIMDLTVPGGMGGVEATQQILELDPNARIIVASGYSNNPVMANFLDYGFLARVEKPYTIENLNLALVAALGE